MAFDDAEGTTPKLSVNLADIFSFLQRLSGKEETEDTAVFIELAKEWDKLIANWRNSLRIRYNSFIDKLEYFINYPDAAINSALSKVFKKDFNLRFRLLQYIREEKNISIDLSFLKADVDSSEESNVPTASVRSLSLSFTGVQKTNNWFEVALKVLCLGIEIDAFTDFFESLVQLFDFDFNFNNWYIKLPNSDKSILNEITLFFVTGFNHLFESFIDVFLQFDLNMIIKNLVDNPKHIKDYIPDYKPTNVAPFVDFLVSITSLLNSKENDEFTNIQTLILGLADAVMAILDLNIFKVPNGVGIALDVGEFILEVYFKYLNFDFV